MAKNILIFSDGTGQAGGFMPDETRSNVYKLYRATRVCPDNKIHPQDQIAFYDPGIGSQGDVGDKRHGLKRRIYNFLGQAAGLGITRNIIDCYAAILRLWEPGDRIVLFGFSRGAYTARCLGGVLYYCGVPTTMKDGSPIRRDPISIAEIASEAVKEVYQYGSSIKGDPLRVERLTRARKFRSDYHSGAATSNVSPYFVGVWDTVATLGAGWLGLICVVILYAVVSSILAYGLTALVRHFFSSMMLPYSAYFLILFVGLPLGLYALMSFKYRQPLSLKRYRMAFYSTNLDPAVRFARHALSIDENRKDFPRVPWAEEPSENAPDNKTKPERFKQIWFAGNHSDIGGSYTENESRLSDVALTWMLEEALSLPEPIKLDRAMLNLYPSSAGPQHDERQRVIDSMSARLRRVLTWILPASRVGWIEGHRTIPNDAPLHPSVIERFSYERVLVYGDYKAYRPGNLRSHNDVGQFYS